MSDQHPPSSPSDQRPDDRPPGPGSDHQPETVMGDNPAHDAADAAAPAPGNDDMGHPEHGGDVGVGGEHAAADPGAVHAYVDPSVAGAAHGHDADGHGHTSDAGHHDHPAHLAHHFETPEQQMESSKLGMWVFLATEILMFGGLFCAYAVYRANNPDVFLFAHKALDTFWGAVNTGVLLASSLTMAWGVRAAQLGQKSLLVVMLCLTLLGGLGFMTIKTIEYKGKWDHQLWVGSGNAFYQQNWNITDDDRAEHGAQYIEKKAGHDTGGHHGDGTHDAHGTQASTKIPGGPDHADESSHLRGQDHTPATDHGHDPHGGPPPVDAPPDAGEGESHAESDLHAPDNSHAGGDGHATPPDSAPISAAAAAEVGSPPSQPAPPAEARVAELVPVSTVARPGMPAASGVIEDLIDNPHPQLRFGETMITGPGAVQASHHGSHYPRLTELDALETSRTHIFFQIYYMMTGLHGIHVLVGMGLIGWITYLAGSPMIKALVGPVASAVLGLYLIFLGTLVGFPIWLIASIVLCFLIAGGVAFLHLARLGKFGGPAFGPEYYTPVDLVGLYWHLVDLIWIFLFPLLYLIH